MLYVLWGTDIHAARDKLHMLVDSLLAKKGDAPLVRADADSFTSGMLDTFIAGQGLFEAKQIVILDHVFQNKEAKDLIVKERKALKESPNIFFLLEGELDKATLDKLEKVAEKALVFGERMVKRTREEAFNTFSIADAFGARDKRKLWVLYIKARRANLSVEEIHGVLFWQVKSLALAEGAESAQEAGLNPFVYKKAKSFSQKFKRGEIEEYMRTLIALSHDARRGKHDFDTALEYFVLTA